jgi:hypothetical protein
MDSRSIPLGEFCERARGEEISKEGLLWVCPACELATVPGRTLKGGAFEEKTCPHCGHLLTSGNAGEAYLVTDSPPTADSVPWVDGDDIATRYASASPRRRMITSVRGFEYKDPLLYRSPKVLIRQAGVGINACLDLLGVRCPQSIYVYRIREPWVVEGYRHEFLLATLLSRTFTYYVFKRFGEVDRARAHAKMTHERPSTLPAPRIDFSDRASRAAHDDIVAAVRRLCAGESELGAEDDLRIELALRALWGITPGEAAYINGEFSHVPAGQVVRELYPRGTPRSARRSVVGQ